MSDNSTVESKDENNKGQQQQQKRPTADAAFKSLNEAKIKAKGEELKKAVDELLKADMLRNAALDKVNGIEEEINELSKASFPFKR
jgi:hypothetical protein